MNQNIVFFDENHEDRFTIPLSDIIRLVKTDVIPIKHRLVLNIVSKPIDLPSLLDNLNKGVSTFQLIPEKIVSSSKHFGFIEKGSLFYNIVSASSKYFDFWKDDFVIYNAIPISNNNDYKTNELISSPFYTTMDRFKYLILQSNDNTRVIKYKDDPNKYELDTINDTSYYEFDKDKRIETLMWFKNNQLHRLNGPAKIIKTFEGKIKTEEWFVNGKHEKEGGPPSDTKLFDIVIMFGEEYEYTSCQEWNFPRKNANGEWLPKCIFLKKINLFFIGGTKMKFKMVNTISLHIMKMEIFYFEHLR